MKTLVIAALGLLVGSCHDAPDRFDRPTALAFGSASELFVSDGYNNARIARFAADGSFELDWGGRGSERGQFRTPHSICVSPDQRVYVADRENARVQVFDRDGHSLAVWPSRVVGRPWAVACSSDGFVYTADGGDQDPSQPRGSVAKFTLDGELLARFTPEPSDAFNGAHSLAVAADGSVFVAEADGRRLRKLVPTP
jgi:DNA-binding beta-propeller fold protein YncE